MCVHSLFEKVLLVTIFLHYLPVIQADKLLDLF